MLLDRRVARAQGDPRVQPATGGIRCARVPGAGDPAGSQTDDEARIVAVAGARPDTLRGALHALEPAEALPLPGFAGDGGLAGASGSDPRPQRDLAATHPQLEAESRPRLRGQSRPGARPLPRAARKRSRDQLRREGAGEPLPQTRPRLGPPRPPRAAPRHLHPPAGDPLPGRGARRARRLPADQGQAAAQRQLDARRS